MKNRQPAALKAAPAAKDTVLLCGLKKAMVFSGSVRTVAVYSPDKIIPALDTVQNHLNKGYYAAGFITFEAGCHLNGVKPRALKKDFPLLCFGIYHPPEIKKVKDALAQYSLPYRVPPLKAHTDEKNYCRGVSAVKKLLKDGELYQVNYCVKNSFEFTGEAGGLFADMYANQPVEYAAYLDLKGVRAASVSPELFFRCKAGRIEMKPMKGTLLKPASKKALGDFKQDPKTLAENLMIVDLIRNDLGRICDPRTIKVKELFGVEEHPTLWQMTSTVNGKLKTGTPVKSILAALFPSGSVTGAPKKRSIEAIQELEDTPRGIYTGAIGYFAPGNEACFNVAIRTAVISGDKGELWTGSGIVADSEAKAEYRETMGKADFFRRLHGKFYIFESMLCGGGGIFLLKNHISRMARAAKEFKIPFEPAAAVKAALKEASRIRNKIKLKMILRQDGSFNFEKHPVKETKSDIRLIVSSLKADSSDIFLRHKTSNRQIYEAALKEAHDAGADDAVISNERGEITEASSSNVFIEKNGKFFTPPLSCGLLAGTYREYLLRANPGKYRERILTAHDLESADGVYLCNSVRLWRRAVIVR